MYPISKTSEFKVMRITSLNEWREDSEVEPTDITGPITQDTSASGNKYTQRLVYQRFGTSHLDIIGQELAQLS